MPNKINLNNASVDELANNIRGVGRETAEKIVDYRDNNGPFEDYDDLRNISDIDDTMEEKIREAAEI